MRLYPGSQLAEPERLNQVVIGTMLHSLDSFFFPRPCGDHDDWNSPCLGVSPESSQQTESINVRHQYVGQYECRFRAFNNGECLLAVLHRFDNVAVTEQ